MSRRGQRLVVWFVTFFAVALATYPSWGARASKPTTTSSMVPAASGVITLDVQGMTCAACEGEIERELVKVPGVVSATVSFKKERAEVGVASMPAKANLLIAAVERAGYRATLEQNR